LAGLECARIIKEKDIMLPWDLWVVNFTDEEGAHNAGTMGSRAMLKGLSRSDLLNTKNRNKSSFAQDLARVGKDPNRISEALLKADDFAFYLELHIEQGKKLEAEGLDIGVVTGIAGIYRYVVTINGEPGHAGTFPMHLRDDALVKAASLISLLPQWAQARNPNMVATIGQLSLNPGAPNVIPGLCSLVVELRSQESSDIKALEQMLERHAALNKGMSIEPVYAKPPCLLHEALIEATEKAAMKNGLDHSRMMSGAGHDATSFAAQNVPAGLIFTPCKKGISHSPQEEIDKEQAGGGCQILLDALLNLAREKFI
jgi:hydantoinase/carbamoylase family amidase